MDCRNRMALLRRPPSLRDVVIEWPRWIRSVASKQVDGELHEALPDTSSMALIPAPRTRPKKTYPPAEVSFQKVSPIKDRPLPKETIQLGKILPEFTWTAAGVFLHGIGFEGLAFDRFAERNPRAFHLSHAAVRLWSDHMRAALSISDNEMRQMLDRSPKLLSVSFPQIDRTLKYLKKKFMLEDVRELRHVVMENPFVFHKDFEVHCNRGVSVLFERYKIAMPDMKHIVLRYPGVLSKIDESFLLSLIALFQKLIEMGPAQLGRMVRGAPEILSHTLFGLQERLSFLVHYQIKQILIRDMLLECPGLLNRRLTAELRHVVNFLEATLNAEQKMVRKILVDTPSVLLMDTEKDIAPNIAAIRNLGFSQHETTVMIVRCPKLLAIKIYDVASRRKLDFLFGELDRDRSVLLTYPQYMVCSWTENLLPRVAFLRHMNLKREIKEWPLMKIFGESDTEFCTRHVKTVPAKYRDFCENWTQTQKQFLDKWAPELTQASL